MISLFFFAYIVTLISATPAPTTPSPTTTTETGTCEDYGLKVSEGESARNPDALWNDPCFGYGDNCCTASNGGGDYCYWKQTDNCDYCAEYGVPLPANEDGNCNACCDSKDDSPSPTTYSPTTPTPGPTTEPTEEPTPAPVTPAPTTPEPTTPEPTTPAPTEEETTSTEPTVHSAKKWTMLHPNYEGGDGELLWNIYYGDYADDVRFDDFRQQQLWDVDVIRTMIEEDVKKMNLAHQISTKHGKGSVLSHHWLMMAAAAMVVMAVFALWMNRRGSYSKIVDSVETEPLVATYGH